jgi:hypothetical protein
MFGLDFFGGDNNMHVWSVNSRGEFCVQSGDSNVYLLPRLPFAVDRGFFNVTMRRTPGVEPSVNFNVDNWVVIRVDDAYRCIGGSCAEGRDDHAPWTMPHINNTVFSLGVSWNSTPSTLADLDFTFNGNLINTPRPTNATLLRNDPNPWRWSCRWSCDICVVSMALHDEPFLSVRLTQPPRTTPQPPPATTTTTTTTTAINPTSKTNTTSTTTMMYTNAPSTITTTEQSTVGTNSQTPTPTMPSDPTTTTMNLTSSTSTVTRADLSSTNGGIDEIGLIIGLSILGVVLLALVIAVGVCLVRRRNRDAAASMPITEQSNVHMVGVGVGAHTISRSHQYNVLPSLSRVDLGIYDSGNIE